MTEWNLQSVDLKHYRHFDPVLSAEAANSLVRDPAKVARHTFYPFIRYVDRWNRFAKKGETGPEKKRPIRYAARADAYIFSYYRHLLSIEYERELSRLELAENILAYRRIPLAEGLGGKCNIHYAHEAFDAIKSLGSCYVIALDIKSYFDRIDHSRLKMLWCRLLNVPKLPSDHYAVFKAITAYSYVDKEDAYQRLGHFGQKRTDSFGRPVLGYITKYKDVPKQICCGKDFRYKIAGGDGNKSIIKKNHKPYGIPQGAPISDLLANLYLLDFDNTLNQRIQTQGGIYLRYSDDILVVVPGSESSAKDLMKEITLLIRKYGSKLMIKEDKSSLIHFYPNGTIQAFRLIEGKLGKNGLEYLGFRFDGCKVYLRDSTLANLRRKVAQAAKLEAWRLVRRYPGKTADELQACFNLPLFIQRFMRVENFMDVKDDFRNWTFWTYARRAEQTFRPTGSAILRQLRSQKALIKYRIEKEIRRALARREASASPG